MVILYTGNVIYQKIFSVSKALFGLKLIKSCTTQTLRKRLVESLVIPHLNYHIKWKFNFLLSINQIPVFDNYNKINKDTLQKFFRKNSKAIYQRSKKSESKFVSPASF